MSSSWWGDDDDEDEGHDHDEGWGSGWGFSAEDNEGTDDGDQIDVAMGAAWGAGMDIFGQVAAAGAAAAGDLSAIAESQIDGLVGTDEADDLLSQVKT